MGLRAVPLDRQRAGAYQRHRPETTTLYAVVRDNVETLYAAVAAGFEGAALPPFVRREFDGYLDCGLLCRGFARLKCVACAEQHLAFGDTRSILEPAGALSIAGLKRIHASGTLAAGPAVAIASGANVPFAKLGYVVERAEVGQLREAILLVTIPERPGSFLEFCQVTGDRSVTEFNYRLGSRQAADVFVGVEVTGAEELRALEESFRARGYRCDDLSHDDLAKTHVRHMVGGHSAAAHDEVLYSFEFPERPGALLEFLVRMGAKWNISLFHYRNHGSAFGRVLCGLEVPEGERAALAETLDALGFAYEDETGSVAARLLIGG